MSSTKDSINKSLLLITPKQYTITFILGLVSSLIPLLLGWVIKIVFDQLNNNHFKSLSLLLLVILLLIVLQNFLFYRLGLLETKIRFRASKTMVVSFINRILLNENKADVTASTALTITNSDFKLVEYKLCSILELVNKIIFFIVALMIMCTINWRLTLYSILPLVLFNIGIYFVRNKWKDKFADNRTAALNYQQFVHDVMSNRDTYKYLDQENLLSNRLKWLGKKSLSTQLKQTLFSFSITTGVTFVNYLSIFVVLMLSIRYLKSGELSIGDLTLFISYIGFGFAYLDLFAAVLNSHKQTEHIVNKVDHLVENSSLGTFSKLNVGYQDDTIEHHSYLIFRNFAMNSNHEPLPNLVIPKGSLVVISGETGMGKSTFINALLGFSSYSGQLIVDGTIVDNLSEYQIGVVPQRYNLFNLPLIDNITLLKNADQAQPALHIANIRTDHIFNISDEQYLGVSGNMISEGQRQRVAIARAVHHGKDFLMLDDAFSYLDKNNRYEIFEKIRNTKATKFIISNDMNFKSKADILLKVRERNIVLVEELN
ncbi:ABC transporter ATP-binding protein/permease [Paenibacillus sp. ACRSA]|uniref:ATP-binding cassette domain-containing protein n=1 Tax=Paenibacillus sp. ACRSA TaxID=2918211 RepID=UPI001EF4963C|nr:ABC transporter ATP-binding protein [Paenibacillus sp. ACRSA]MCG7378291.1 ABC transporter ATP-binding protein/permease [Paenibacillus sp. ACRSA]